MYLRVNTTQVRPRLTELLGRVEHGGEQVIIARHGKAVAAIVSMPDWNRIQEAQDEELYGPVNPETGRRRGGLIRALGMVKGMFGDDGA